jgi:ribonuclease HIII
MGRSDIAENFINQLKSEFDEESGKIIFSTHHLDACLSSLASSIMAREKLAFEK